MFPGMRPPLPLWETSSSAPPPSLWKKLFLISSLNLPFLSLKPLLLVIVLRDGLAQRWSTVVLQAWQKSLWRLAYRSSGKRHLPSSGNHATPAPIRPVMGNSVLHCYHCIMLRGCLPACRASCWKEEKELFGNPTKPTFWIWDKSLIILR